jgi:hypothetical protein
VYLRPAVGIGLPSIERRAFLAAKIERLGAKSVFDSPTYT